MTVETARQIIAALCKQDALTLEVFEGVLSCLPRAVRPARKLGRPTLYPDAQTWDWTKSDIEISRARAINLKTVKDIRKRLGMAVVAAPRNAIIMRAERTKWDWSKSDSELGAEHGISRERVRQIRAALGMPSRLEDEKTVKTEQEKKFLQWVNSRTAISQSEAEKSGLNGDSVKRWCAKHGIIRELKNRPCIRPWHLMNWDLPNYVLGEVWGVKNFHVANVRCHKGKPKSKWCRKRNVPPEIIAQEKINANTP